MPRRLLTAKEARAEIARLRGLIHKMADHRAFWWCRFCRRTILKEEGSPHRRGCPFGALVAWTDR